MKFLLQVLLDKIGTNYFHPSISLIISNTKVSLGAISRGIFRRNYFYRSKYRLPNSICIKSRKLKLKNNLFVRVPVKAEEYLKFVYGINWSKPIEWEEDDQDKYYNFGYIRRGKRYVLLDLSQRLLSKLSDLLKVYCLHKFNYILLLQIYKI